MSRETQIAIKILETFEGMLEEKNITIPDEDDAQREADNRARLYGYTYFSLEEKIAQILSEELGKTE